MTHGDRYASFSDLDANEVAGIDFRVTINRIDGSRIAILAPHGGAIENNTSNVAKAIAGEDYNLYLFEGIKLSGNFSSLHLTSHRFDEPQCLDLIRTCDVVVAVHGCAGRDEVTLIGGLDARLGALIGGELVADNFAVKTTGHQFPGKESANICNRGRSGVGVQLEMSTGLRHGPQLERFAISVRRAMVRNI